MPETPQEPRHKFSALTTLAAVLAAFLLAVAAYVCWQAAHILFPQNVYETALPITISDTIEADGVLLFDETCISGSGNLFRDGDQRLGVISQINIGKPVLFEIGLQYRNDSGILFQKAQYGNISGAQLRVQRRQRGGMFITIGGAPEIEFTLENLRQHSVSRFIGRVFSDNPREQRFRPGIIMHPEIFSGIGQLRGLFPLSQREISDGTDRAK